MAPQIHCPLRIRILQATAFLLSVAGMIFLFLCLSGRNISGVQAANITPDMNFTTVRMIGEVTRTAHLFDSGEVVFDLNDGSGDVAVWGGRTQARALLLNGRLPRRGDRVTVVGTLGVSADKGTRLRLLSASSLELTRKSVPPALYKSVCLSDISPSCNGELVDVRGTLKEVSLPRPGSRAPYIFTIEEGDATLDVVFWDEVFYGLNGTFPIPGKRLCVRGQVSLYKGAVQITLISAEDLRVLR